MSKWIAEFELEDGDTMPKHMDLNYKGAKIDFHCKPLEQEPILDKIYADIQRLRGCSCSCSDGIIDDVEDILDKYKADRSEKETETWNGIHAQITVPKGTFDKIFNDTEEDIDDI